MSFKEINFPNDYCYKSDSDNPPIEFYEEAFPRAKKIDLLLGYFSSNAIKAISESFAEFIYYGGSIRIITNHVMSLNDKENLIDISDISEEDKVINIFSDLESLQKNLSDHNQHFFDCLKYLIKSNRLLIVPVKFKNIDLSHSKRMILFDGENYLRTDGSINFTYNALMKNSESFSVDPSWMGEIFRNRIDNEKENFEKIFNKEHKDYRLINSNEIEVVINSIGKEKEIKDLLEDAVSLSNDTLDERVIKIKEKRKLRFNQLIQNIEQEPNFTNGRPLPHQIEAYKLWKENNQMGLFAMATGTGKTVASLNCILEEYRINKYYRFIVLVPTISLAHQWENEISLRFNFKDVIVFSSQNNFWDREIMEIGKSIFFGTAPNFCIITTYATFRTSKFQSLFNRFFENEMKNMTLIADEAHTMGSTSIINVFPHKILKRIGLSATPERQYDEFGGIEVAKYFNSEPPNYTFSYNMKKAIDEELLCKYYYYPKFVELSTNELNEYIKITNKLKIHFDFENGRYYDNPVSKKLQMDRKRIIHKAYEKEKCLIKIIKEIGPSNFKNGFIYVPEGYAADYLSSDMEYVDPSDNQLIKQYTETLHKEFGFKLRTFTGETKDRQEIIQQFKSGKLHALLAMKCLDEGVDIPQTQYAIFCSSTGNPRQYIQRRGRVLRTYKGKEFSYLYDMIVKPAIEPTNIDLNTFNIEKNIFRAELIRLINFAVLAENKMECLNQLESICLNFDIDVYEMANKELEKYNN